MRHVLPCRPASCSPEKACAENICEAQRVPMWQGALAPRGLVEEVCCVPSWTTVRSRKNGQKFIRNTTLHLNA